MRRPLIAGNWKMNLGVADSVRLAEALRAGLGSVPDREVAVFPTFVSIASVARALEGSPVKVGGQDNAADLDGAFTGAVSASILKSAGASMVILGHSERRHVFGESDAVHAKKLQRALDAGLLPILCVGETQGERDSGATSAVVLRQLHAFLDAVPAAAFPKLTLAYEPVWAIGTGRTATVEQAAEVHALLRNAFRERAGAVAEDARILYGGSVKSSNIAALMAAPDIDGALVGGAALQADEFLRIIHFQRN